MTDKEILLSIFKRYEGVIAIGWLHSEAIHVIKSTIPEVNTYFHQVERSDRAFRRYKSARQALLDDGIIEECDVVLRKHFADDGTHTDTFHKLPTGVTDTEDMMEGFALIKN